MTRDARERLQDIADALAAITDYVGGSLAAPSIGTPVVLDAVLFRLLVVGEAAKSLDPATMAGAPEIPWRDYAGLRDVIAHHYFRVQRQIIEDTVRRDLPTLERAVETLLT
jgi:uncharacterized protein with HEPN domain